MTSLELDPEIWDRPGYVLTADGRSSIALCGGWEMSTECRRGPRDGETHILRPEYSHSGSVSYWCEHCEMPLHPIGIRPKEAALMSIEKHVIEEWPW